MSQEKFPLNTFPAPQFRRSLVSPTQTKKAVSIFRQGSNSSNSSSGGETGNPNPRSGKKLDPIMARFNVDSLQSEIQVTRSDNSILRQDIQVQFFLN
jgi:hypothetical protein